MNVTKDTTYYVVNDSGDVLQRDGLTFAPWVDKAKTWKCAITAIRYAAHLAKHRRGTLSVRDQNGDDVYVMDGRYRDE